MHKQLITLAYESSPATVIRHHPEDGSVSIDMPATRYAPARLAIWGTFSLLSGIAPVVGTGMYVRYHPEDQGAKLYLFLASFFLPALAFCFVWLVLRIGKTSTYIKGASSEVRICSHTPAGISNIRIPSQQISSIYIRPEASEVPTAFCIQRKRYDTPDEFLQGRTRAEIQQVVTELKKVLRISTD
jgi:hypothetical protein